MDSYIEKAHAKDKLLDDIFPMDADEINALSKSFINILYSIL